MPADLKLHPRVQRVVDDRRKMAAGEIGCDWGFAETLAYASLLSANFNVRLIGQDTRRGTFFHRHAALIDQTTGEAYVPLAHVGADPHALMLSDSLLSEEAVLGFEYGYSTTSPDSLVIWEAQFGDFVNGAQVVIDQFISSGEAKWGRLCGLTMFLPHGYEGQGPEHSSARLERFLQLCAEHNMQVVVPSTPAQMFHMLRRQMLRQARKPLVVLTPKSLLRHKLSVSTLADFANGRFMPMIEDPETPSDESVTRVVFCSGKVYFDLAEYRRAENVAGVAIVRDRGAVSVPGRRVRKDHRALPERERDRVVPGRAAESGGVVSDPPSPPGAAVGPAAAVLRGPAGRGRAGLGHPCIARASAASARRGRASVVEPRARGIVDGRQARLESTPRAARGSRP